MITIPTEAEVNAKIQELKDAEAAVKKLKKHLANKSY